MGTMGRAKVGATMCGSMLRPPTPTPGNDSPMWARWIMGLGALALVAVALPLVLLAAGVVLTFCLLAAFMGATR